MGGGCPDHTHSFAYRCFLMELQLGRVDWRQVFLLKAYITFQLEEGIRVAKGRMKEKSQPKLFSLVQTSSNTHFQPLCLQHVQNFNGESGSQEVEEVFDTHRGWIFFSFLWLRCRSGVVILFAIFPAETEIPLGEDSPNTHKQFSDTDRHIQSTILAIWTFCNFQILRIVTDYIG